MNDVKGRSDFLDLAIDLQTDRKYLQVAAELERLRKKRIILDREAETPYLIRYYYLNLRPFVRVVIHRFIRSDIDGLHDHPWAFQNYILTGGYWEHTIEGKFWREPGYHGIAEANFLHRVELDPEKSNHEEIWTLFMMGPKEKSWGFIDNDGTWVEHKTYLENRLKA